MGLPKTSNLVVFKNKACSNHYQVRALDVTLSLILVVVHKGLALNILTLPSFPSYLHTKNKAGIVNLKQG